MNGIILPPPLKAGDKIAIISPASIINPDYVEGAVAALRQEGWDACPMEHALGEWGSYSGTPDDRIADITEAFTNPEYKAVMCSRGGYGMVQLLDRLPEELFTSTPKWLIGFSDISAFHALMSRYGIASIHASICKHLALHGTDDKCSRALFGILRGAKPVYEVNAHPWNREGEASGTLVGGNMAVLGGLVGTPYDIYSRDNAILFFEDIAEPIYKVERMLYQLKLNGTLDRAKGIIIGRFTEYKGDRNHKTMEEVFRQFTSQLSCPVAYDFPVGHIDENLPLIESAPVTLSVNSGAVKLEFV